MEIDNRSKLFRCPEGTCKHNIEGRCQIQYPVRIMADFFENKVECENYEKMVTDFKISDEEMYKKIQLLRDDNEILGCYIEGHYDLEQFERVAIDFLKTECDMERPKKYREVKVGYYKAVPYDDRSYYHFKEQFVRGAKTIMEMQYF